MGHIVHHAIVVTTWDAKLARMAQKFAKNDLGCAVTGVTESGTNRYLSFMVCPDGSKSGWEESDNGDTRRNEFVKWLHEQRYEDGSSPFAWCEVKYSSDDGAAEVTRHEWANALEETP